MKNCYDRRRYENNGVLEQVNIESGETLKHFFFECKFSMSLWKISYADIMQARSEQEDDISSWEIFLNILQEKDLIETWMITS